METRIADRPAFRLVGHAPACRSSTTASTRTSKRISHHCLPRSTLRLKELSNTEPAGLLQVSADVDPDYTEGSELTYLHGVAVREGTRVPEDLDADRSPCRRLGSIPHRRTVSGEASVDMGGNRHRLVPVQPVATPARPLHRGHPRPLRRLQHCDHRVVAAYRTLLTGYDRASWWATPGARFQSARPLCAEDQGVRSYRSVRTMRARRANRHLTGLARCLLPECDHGCAHP